MSGGHIFGDRLASDGTENDADAIVAGGKGDIFQMWNGSKDRPSVRRLGAQTCPRVLDRALTKGGNQPCSGVTEPCFAFAGDAGIESHLFFRASYNDVVAFGSDIGPFAENDVLEGSSGSLVGKDLTA